MGWGVLSCVVDHILQEFNTLLLTRFRTYKIATPPQTKTPVKTTFRDWCLYSSFVHGSVHLDPGATTAAVGAGAAGQEGKDWHTAVYRDSIGVHPHSLFGSTSPPSSHTQQYHKPIHKSFLFSI